MRKFDKKTYKDYDIFYDTDLVEIINPDSEGKVLIKIKSSNKELLVTEEKLQMWVKQPFHLGDYISTIVNDYSGIVIDINDANDTVLCIDAMGIIHLIPVLNVYVVDQLSKEQIYRNFIRNNHYWDGQILHTIIPDDDEEFKCGLVIKENDPNSIIQKQLAEIMNSLNNKFVVGEWVYISKRFQTYKGKYFAVYDNGKSGFIDSNNVITGEEFSYPHIIFSDQEAPKIGIILRAQLPKVTYVNEKGETLKIENATEYQKMPTRKYFYESLWKSNHIFKDGKVRRIIIQKEPIKMKALVVNRTFINDVVLFSTHTTQAEVGMSGNITDVIRDYKNKLYYLIYVEQENSTFLVNKGDAMPTKYIY